MNNTHALLNNLTKYSSSEMFAEDFLQNLKRFEFLIDERFTSLSLDFDNFLKLMPDYVVDLSKSPECLLNLYADSVIDGKKRVTVIKPLEEDGISVTFEFNSIGRLMTIVFRSEDKCLTLDSNQDIVVFEKRNFTIKLVNLFKDYFALNIKRNSEKYFNNVVSIEKEKLDNRIMYSKFLLGI